MNWMARLYETYEQGLQLELRDDERLMPVSHTIQNAHINIVLDLAGNFLSAKVLEKTQIMLPATEKSAGRSSGEAPHPLADKLQYVAGDYAEFGGVKKHYFEGYKAQLERWSHSQFNHPHIRAVLDYVSKRRVIKDLIDSGICQADDKGILLTSWPHTVNEENPMPLLFKVLPKESGKLDQGNALVCWSVHESASDQFNTWTNELLQKRWIEFDADNSGASELCLISGERLPIATNHPAKLRHTGDKAKLISANDSFGFTYRGRFIEAGNVANVSFEVTQKAHNALRWLIGPRKQAYRSGDKQVIVSWAVSGKDIPNPMELPMSLDDSFDSRQQDDDQAFATSVDTAVGLGQQFAIALKKHMAGYYQRFEETPLESVVVMGLDSATPGRMAITYYRDLMAKEYLEVINQWYSDFAWPQRIVKDYVDSKGKERKQVRWLAGAPTPWVILNACYGDVVKSNDSLKKQVSERLLPCILERHPLPRDLLQLAQHRASNPNSGDRWEWERNVGVTCALYRGFYIRHPNKSKRRNYPMSLDTENNSRDYLFGRLLALAERVEEVALHAAGQERPTAANRLMQRFSDRPYETWLVIYKQLEPYIRQLKSSRPGFLFNINQEMDQVMCKFEREDYMNPGKLTGEYLLGFHCQRLALRKDRKADESNQTTQIQE